MYTEDAYAHESEHLRLKEYGRTVTALPPANTNPNGVVTFGGVQFVSNGTRWLSDQLFTLPLNPRDGAMPLAAGTHNFEVQVPRHYVGGWYLEDIKWEFFSSTAQTGAIYYSLAAFAVRNGGTTTPISAVSGEVDTKLATVANQHYSPALPIVYNSARPASDYLLILQAAIGAGAPGTYILNAVACVRLIGV